MQTLNGNPTRRKPGKPPLYGEPTIRRSVDIPLSLYTMLQRHVTEQNFRAGRSVTSGGRVMVDQLYDFFGLDNPSKG